MAQNVTVAGASYQDVPSVELPTTGGGTSAFYDVSATTATADDVAQGKQFYSASGALTTGTASGGGGVFYGTCATAAATAAKAVVCEEFTSDHLVEGTVVIVKFTNAQTYNGAPTLNVQSTGAKNIKRIGTTNAGRYEWQAGEVLQFVYDGSYWVLTDGGFATTTYYGVTKLSSATNSTSTALAATASAVKAAYDHASAKQDALVSGTNIKTVNGESLLGSGDLAVSGGSTVAVTQTLTSGTEIASISVDGTATKLYAPEGGSVSMTEEEVDAAVEAAWPTPTGYTITPGQAYVETGTLKAIGLSDEVSSGEFIDTAAEGETVYVLSRGGHWKPNVTIDSSGSAVSYELYGPAAGGTLYVFTMPADAVTVNMWYND